MNIQSLPAVSAASASTIPICPRLIGGTVEGQVLMHLGQGGRSAPSGCLGEDPMTTRAQLTAIIGEQAGGALIARHPGRRPRVPKTAAILAPVIGEASAATLSRALPHVILRIPLAN